MVRLEGYGDRKPAQLSGGQRQRVALARAIVNKPQVLLLLDEPLGALDLKLRQEMQIELKRIQQEVGITFVYVTHDQEEALTMSDRVAVFNRGRIEQVGAAGRGVRAPGERVHRRLRRRLERDRARRPPLHGAAGEDPRPRRGGEPEAGVARGGGDGSRRPVRRAGDPVPRQPRPGRRAPGARAEPGGDLERGAGDEGTSRAARSGVPDRNRKSSNRRDRRHEQKTTVRRTRRTRCSRSACSPFSRQAAGATTRAARAQIEGLGTTLEEIQAQREGGRPGQPRPVGRLRGRSRSTTFDGGDRLQGEHEGRRQLGRDDDADADGRVRRRLGIGRCERSA